MTELKVIGSLGVLVMLLALALVLMVAYADRQREKYRTAKAHWMRKWLREARKNIKATLIIHDLWRQRDQAKVSVRVTEALADRCQRFAADEARKVELLRARLADRLNVEDDVREQRRQAEDEVKRLKKQMRGQVDNKTHQKVREQLSQTQCDLSRVTREVAELQELWRVQCDRTKRLGDMLADLKNNRDIHEGDGQRLAEIVVGGNACQECGFEGGHYPGCSKMPTFSDATKNERCNNESKRKSNAVV